MGVYETFGFASWYIRFMVHSLHVYWSWYWYWYWHQYQDIIPLTGTGWGWVGCTGLDTGLDTN